MRLPMGSEESSVKIRRNSHYRFQGFRRLSVGILAVISKVRFPHVVPVAVLERCGNMTVHFWA